MKKTNNCLFALGFALMLAFSSKAQAEDVFIPKPTALNFISAKAVDNGSIPEGDFVVEVDAGTKAKGKPIKNETRIILKEDFDSSTVYYKIGSFNTTLTFGIPNGSGTAASTGTDGKGYITDPVKFSTYADIITNVIVFYSNAPHTGGTRPDGSWYLGGAGREITFVVRDKFSKRYWLNDPINNDTGSATAPLITLGESVGVTVTWPEHPSESNKPTVKTTYAYGEKQ